MHLPFSVIRVIFIILCTLSGCFYGMSPFWPDLSWTRLLSSGAIGLGGGIGLMALNPLLKKSSLKSP